ncbi:hypothetical protein JTB14_037429 [Gonioctena quinquepunctata]|nr:hypothetical protein JTB14_037429 [Gonioctena quinquepunctata]
MTPIPETTDTPDTDHRMDRPRQIHVRAHKEDHTRSHNRDHPGAKHGDQTTNTKRRNYGPTQTRTQDWTKTRNETLAQHGYGKKRTEGTCPKMEEKKRRPAAHKRKEAVLTDRDTTKWNRDHMETTPNHTTTPHGWTA